MNKLRQYSALVKPSLSLMVVFSSVMCYLLVEDVHWRWSVLAYLALGGFLITASANTLNQIIEKKSDALMPRTAKRPLASDQMRVGEAQVFAFLTAFAGSVILYVSFGGMVLVLSLVSLSLYAWVYTPAKKINSLAVFIGAIPGALPCLIGWVAGEPTSWSGGWVLFLFQFFWQFPHFWAIAWLSHKDYTQAGFKLLPSSDGNSKYATLQALLYTILLFPISFLPILIGMVKVSSMFWLLFVNILMLIPSIFLYRYPNKRFARMVMFSSYFYLAVVFFILLWYKYS